MSPPAVRRWLASSAAACLVALLAAGCPDQTSAACGDEPGADVCARLGFDCDTITVCYACGAAKRIDCGQCSNGQTCGGGGQPHVCWPPLDAGADALADAAVEAPPADAAPSDAVVLCPDDAVAADTTTNGD